MKKMRFVNDQHGAIAVIVGIVLVLLLGFAAFAVDLGYVMVTRNELQNAADGAALAATRQLGVIYEGLHYGELSTYVCDQALLTGVSREVALKNIAAGKTIQINDSDVTIGKWDSSTKVFTPTLVAADAVRVRVRRDGSANGPIPTFFGKFLGRDSVEVSAVATAALTAESSINTGGLPIPVGISRYWFENMGEFCNQPIKFYPTGDLEGCAGWHTFEESPPNANTLRNILDALMAGRYPSPEVTAYSTDLEFIGGNVATDLSNLKALFDFCRVTNDPDHYCHDKDTSDATWTTAVVVYDYTDLSAPCANPNMELPIVGFATVTITEVQAPPVGQLIMATVRCNNAEEGRGGAGNFGTIGTIPGLVQ